MTLQAAARLVSDSTGISASRIEHEKAVFHYTHEQALSKAGTGLYEAIEVLSNHHFPQHNHHNPVAAEVAAKG